MFLPRPRRRGRARVALLVSASTIGILLVSCGSSPQLREASVLLPGAENTDIPTAAPSPTPSPAPPTSAPSYSGPVSYGPAPRPAPPRYPLVGHFDAPSVGVHLPLVAVGVVRGAMDAPEGPIGSIFWREAFWLDLGAVPGTAGTATIAGHLDDYDGRPAAFWNIRYLQVGAEVTVTRASDGAVQRFRIVETDTWSLSQANTATNLQRIYGGGPSDGVARLSLITCTGRWVNGEYDHRFVAFATLEG
jgi:sortase family protein